MAQRDFAQRPDRASNVVCLCGSSRFPEAFEAAGHLLTLEGHIVVSIVNPSQQVQGSVLFGSNALEELERQKIDHSDELIVLNVNGYIDETMRRQLVYAQRAGLPVSFLEPEHWNAPIRGVRHAPGDREALPLTGAEEVRLEEGAVLDLSEPFIVTSGAVLLYGPDETRPAFTLVSHHVWPGVRWVSEVWYAEAATNTAVRAFHADEAALQPLGELIRWAVGTSGQISERMLWALLTVGSVSTQDELSAIIGCRRESVTSAMRDLREQGLIEKVEGRIRLTERGVVCAANLCAFDEDERYDSSRERNAFPLESLHDPRVVRENPSGLETSRFS
jgi:biotin operon repressor